ncbi:uncharacterized protein LOC112571072 [Pomacea canaliculata]|nr:uncharacterized protein LOC112571072 [Pomacea canaliculata]
MSWFNKLFGLDNEKLGFRSIHEKPILTPFFPPTDVEPPQQRTVEPPHQSTVEAPDKKQSSPQVDERQHLSMDLGFQSSETRGGQLMAQARELVLRVVPLEEDDCLSCKLIGTGVCWGAAVFVIWSYRRSKAKYTGFKRTFFALQAFSLVFGLSLMGTARLLDKSLFERPKDPDEERSLSKLFKDDINYFKSLFSNLSKSSTASSSSANSETASKKPENKQDA